MPSTWSTISSPPPNSSGDRSSNHGPSSTWDIFEHSLVSNSSDSSPPDALLAHPRRSPTLAVRITSEIAYLLHAYQTGVATWMDLFDHGCTYQRAVSRLILDSELLLHCVCAFTAKNLSLLPSGMAWASTAAHHYDKSLRLLRELLNNSIPQENALTAIILLSSYEMIAAQGQELQRHFFGATLLIRTHGISAGSHGINRANFWIYIRHEIVVALVNESPLQMSPNEWNVNWRDGETEEDVLGNQLLWLVGRAIDVVFAKDPNTQEPMPIMADARNDLLREADRWLAALPSSFRTTTYGEPTDEGFSRLYYSLPTVGEW